MYRAARLWLPTLTGAIAAGAFFGLSAMLTYQAWYHLNIAYGTVFLPLTLEAAVRLRRDPTIGRGVILGVVLGASVAGQPGVGGDGPDPGRARPGRRGWRARAPGPRR